LKNIVHLRAFSSPIPFTNPTNSGSTNKEHESRRNAAYPDQRTLAQISVLTLFSVSKSHRGKVISARELESWLKATRHVQFRHGTIAAEEPMAVTKDDLRDFQRFADERLNGGGIQSLVDLAGQWEAHRLEAQRREMEETLADINASHADIEAGRVTGVAEAFADVRQQLGLG
jgi:hypothetical protein